MDFIIITDTITGRELRVIQPTSEPKFLAITSKQDEPLVVREIRERSVGKVIRTWMRECKKEVG